MKIRKFLLSMKILEKKVKILAKWQLKFEDAASRKTLRVGVGLVPGAQGGGWCA